MAYFRVFIMAMTLLHSVTASAQNEIDRLVDQFSTVGWSTFTSAVERDPKTHKIVKTVKTLETNGQNIGALKKAFEHESSTGNFSKKKEGNVTKMALTVQTDKTNRVYMLNFSSNGYSYHNGKATIIVKVRQLSNKEKDSVEQQLEK